MIKVFIVLFISIAAGLISSILTPIVGWLVFALLTLLGLLFTIDLSSDWKK